MRSGTNVSRKEGTASPPRSTAPRRSRSAPPLPRVWRAAGPDRRRVQRAARLQAEVAVRRRPPAQIEDIGSGASGVRIGTCFWIAQWTCVTTSTRRSRKERSPGRPLRAGRSGSCPMKRTDCSSRARRPRLRLDLGRRRADQAFRLPREGRVALLLACRLPTLPPGDAVPSISLREVPGPGPRGLGGQRLGRQGDHVGIPPRARRDFPEHPRRLAGGREGLFSGLRGPRHTRQLFDQWRRYRG